MTVEQFIPTPTEPSGIDTETLRQAVMKCGTRQYSDEKFDAGCELFVRFKARIEYPSRRHGTARRIPQSVVLANGETYLPEVRR